MGSASSKTGVEALNEVVTNSVMKVMKTCSAKSHNTISMDVGTVGGDLNIGSSDPANRAKMKQYAKSSINCTQTTDLQSAIKSEIKNGIQAEASTSGKTWMEPPGNTKSEVATKVTNRDVTNWDVSDVQACGSNSSNDFIIKADVVKGNVNFNPDIEQNAHAEILACVQSTSSIQEKVSKLSTDIAAKAASKNALDSIAALLAAGMGMLVMLAVVGLVVMMILKGNKSKKAGARGPGARGPRPIRAPRPPQ